MENERIVNFIIVISSEERNLNQLLKQISQDGIPVFEMTSTKAICRNEN
jgi:hypothetical protein